MERYFYVPEKIKIELDHMDVPPPVTKAGLFFIISSILTCRQDKLKDNGHVPLHSDILKGKMHHYKDHLRFIEKNDIITCDHDYQSDRFCIGYQIHPRIEIDAIIACPRGKRRKEKEKKEKYDDILQPASHLIPYFDGLEFNYDGAVSFFQNQTCPSNDPHEKIKFKLQTARSLVGCERMKNRDFDFSIDDFGQRFHSPLTGLKKEGRQFLTYKGDQLVSLDIKSSQPYLMMPFLYENENIKKQVKNQSGAPYSNYSNSISDIINILFNLSNLSSSSLSPSILSYMSRQVWTDERIRSVPPDVKLYRELLGEGRLYKYLREQAEGLKGLIFDDETAFKEEVMLVMFSDNRYLKGIKKLFAELFPTVYSVMKFIKKGNKRTLPAILQRLESTLMIGIVTKEIAEKWPAVPIFTIHDCIMTTQENVMTVKSVMEKYLFQLTGIIPAIAMGRTKCDTPINVANGPADQMRHPDQMRMADHLHPSIDSHLVRGNDSKQPEQLNKQINTRKRMTKDREFYEKQLNALLNQPFMDDNQKRQLRKVKQKLNDPDYFERKSNNMKRDPDQLRNEDEQPGPNADGGPFATSQIPEYKFPATIDITEKETSFDENKPGISMEDKIMLRRLTKRYGLISISIEDIYDWINDNKNDCIDVYENGDVNSFLKEHGVPSVINEGVFRDIMKQCFILQFA